MFRLPQSFAKYGCIAKGSPSAAHGEGAYGKEALAGRRKLEEIRSVWIAWIYIHGGLLKSNKTDSEVRSMGRIKGAVNGSM